MAQISQDVEKLYDLEGDWDEVIFTCHNPTSSPVLIDLFSPILAYQVNIPNGPQFPPVFYIDGSAEYNYTVRDFFNAPAWVRRIYVYSKNEVNLKQVITHLYKDANGVECQIPRIPSLSVGINQFQNWIAELDFPNKECVFGINQWFQNVLISANSDIGFLLIYKQIDKSELLSIASAYGDSTLCDEVSSCPNTVRDWSERDLELNTFIQETPFKQNMFKGQKYEAVTPFSFELLKLYSGLDFQNRNAERYNQVKKTIHLRDKQLK